MGLKGAVCGLGVMGFGNVMWYLTDISDLLKYPESASIPAQKKISHNYEKIVNQTDPTSVQTTLTTTTVDAQKLQTHKDVYTEVEKVPGVQTGIVVVKQPLLMAWYTVTETFGGALYTIDFSL